MDSSGSDRICGDDSRGKEDRSARHRLHLFPRRDLVTEAALVGLLDPADLAQVVVDHPAVPGQVPPDVRLRVHRGAVHVDDRALGQAADHRGRERRRHRVVGASTREHVSPDGSRSRGVSRVLSARKVQEMPAARVPVEEHPARRAQTAARVLTEALRKNND